MDSIDEIRKKREAGKQWGNTQAPWGGIVGHIDLLLAEIDRLKAENERLTKNIEAYLKGEQQDQSHG